MHVKKYLYKNILNILEFLITCHSTWYIFSLLLKLDDLQFRGFNAQNALFSNDIQDYT